MLDTIQVAVRARSQVRTSGCDRANTDFVHRFYFMQKRYIQSTCIYRFIHTNEQMSDGVNEKFVYIFLKLQILQAQKMERQQWYVITGGPGSGKTTAINALGSMGYRIVPEVARYLYEYELESGRALNEIKSDQVRFQTNVMQMQSAIEQREQASGVEETIFFDRALLDCEAYYRFHGVPCDKDTLLLFSKSKYRKIFLFDLLPFETCDNLRTESMDQAKEIERLIKEVYSKYDFVVISVPVMPTGKRIEFILENL